MFLSAQRLPAQSSLLPSSFSHLGTRPCCTLCLNSLFFLTDTSPTKIYTLSLHDALPILPNQYTSRTLVLVQAQKVPDNYVKSDRKSTRLNSSHQISSYAVFCLKKKSRSGLFIPTISSSPCSRQSV